MLSFRIHSGHVLDSLRAMPRKSVHCAVTSPPYWALRCYSLPPSHWGDGWKGCLGLEPNPKQFVDHIVEVFEAVRDVLRDDGTLWLNMGDSYSNAGKHGGKTSGKHVVKKSEDRAQVPRDIKREGVKPKDLLGMPWRIALALQDAGWYLRSEVIWHKRSPMPETVTDRPSRSHEHIFLLTKSPKYFYDHVGSAEPASTGTHSRGKNTRKKHGTKGESCNESHSNSLANDVATRNMRTVWSLSTEPLKQKHFAAYPSKLVEKCLKAGVSAGGVCGVCGTPRVRIVESERVPTRSGETSKVLTRQPAGWASGGAKHTSVDWQTDQARGIEVGNRDPYRHVTRKVTKGWHFNCECGAGEPVPPTVLDPFLGSGTTAMVALRMGCHAVGCELNPDYIAIARERVREKVGSMFVVDE